MGPDCGTALIGGVPLGFANAVRRGPIGVVGVVRDRAPGGHQPDPPSRRGRLARHRHRRARPVCRGRRASVPGRRGRAGRRPGHAVLVGSRSPATARSRQRVLARLAELGKPRSSSTSWAARGAAGRPHPRQRLGRQPRGGGAGGLALSRGELSMRPDCAVALARERRATAAGDRAEARRRPFTADPRLGGRRLRPSGGGLFAGGTLAQEAAAGIARALGTDAERRRRSARARCCRLGGHASSTSATTPTRAAGPTRSSTRACATASSSRRPSTGEVALFLLDVDPRHRRAPGPGGALCAGARCGRARPPSAGGRPAPGVASCAAPRTIRQGYERQRTALEAQRRRRGAPVEHGRRRVAGAGGGAAGGGRR